MKEHTTSWNLLTTDLVFVCNPADRYCLGRFRCPFIFYIYIYSGPVQICALVGPLAWLVGILKSPGFVRAVLG